MNPPVTLPWVSSPWLPVDLRARVGRPIPSGVLFAPLMKGLSELMILAGVILLPARKMAIKLKLHMFKAYRRLFYVFFTKFIPPVHASAASVAEAMETRFERPPLC